jgi:enoyl-CoA hydratase/carnithine racemase
VFCRLVGIVGRRQALRMMCGCEKVGAEEAAATGLADAVVPPDAAVAAAHRLLEPVVRTASSSGGSGDAVRHAKLLVAHIDGQLESHCLRVERQAFATLFGSTHNRDLMHATLRNLKSKS